MSESVQDSEKIEGTYVFDGAQSRKGYRLNKFFFSLNKRREPHGLQGGCRGAHGPLRPVRRGRRQKLREKDWLALAREGGANIYFMYKMGSVTGDSLQHIGAAFRGETLEEFLSTRKVQGAR